MKEVDLLETVKLQLEANLDEHKGPVLVGLSGGADSVALVLAIHRLGYPVHALHCNFELRGVESDGDEAFVRRLCKEKGIGLTVKHFRTRSHALRKRISVEMAARELRYEWFAQQTRQQGAAAMAVAHHRDDQVETLLLNLVRGTGIHGLTGMKAKSQPQGFDVPLLRPLLNVARADIEAWLKEQGQTWVVDSTNLQAEAAQRNKIRLQVMPLMAELNPNISQTLQETAQRMAEAEALYDEAVVAARRHIIGCDGSISIPLLKASTSPQTLLFEFLRPLGFGSDQVADIYAHLEGDSGHVWESRTHRLLRDRSRLLVSPRTQNAPSGGRSLSVILPLEGYCEPLPGVRLLVRRQAVDSFFKVPRGSNTACFDLEKLTLPLSLRFVQEGDRMQPFGMSGTRLVSDMLTDLKLSLFEKEHQCVVECGDSICWLLGRRVAAGYEVDSSTRHVMIITQETR